MEAEIVQCKNCRNEYELLFDSFENCISQTNCNCARKDKPKYLDEAFKKLEEYLNEKSFSKNQRHSKKSQVCS